MRFVVTTPVHIIALPFLGMCYINPCRVICVSSRRGFRVLNHSIADPARQIDEYIDVIASKIQNPGKPHVHVALNLATHKFAEVKPKAKAA